MKTSKVYNQQGERQFTPRMFRQFVCNRDAGHVEPYRGEVNLTNGANKPWKRCQCGGEMVLKSFRLTPDNQIIPNVKAYGPKPEKKTQAPTAKQLIDRILRNKNIASRFVITRHGLGQATLKMHNDVTWSPENGGIKRDTDTVRLYREVELYADPSSRSVLVTLHGCPGWAEWFKVACKKSHINAVIDFKHAKSYLVGEAAKQAAAQAKADEEARQLKLAEKAKKVAAKKVAAKKSK